MPWRRGGRSRAQSSQRGVAVAVWMLSDAFDLRIFVNADSDVCLARRLRRDIVERGRDVDSVLAQYERFVKPARARCVFIVLDALQQ